MTESFSIDGGKTWIPCEFVTLTVKKKRHPRKTLRKITKGPMKLTATITEEQRMQLAILAAMTE